LDEFIAARNEIAPEHIEEDLEAERVNALYLLNHYFKVSQAPIGAVRYPLMFTLACGPWWQPRSGNGKSLD